MSTKKKSDSVKYLEQLSSGPLTFGKLIRSIRLGEGATQKDFADLLEISFQHLSDIEAGRRVVSPERAAKFAGKLKYSEAHFVELVVQEMLNSAGLDNLKVKVS